jgi:hypothetical protein
MKSYFLSATWIAAGLMAATPAIAQTTTDGAKPGAPAAVHQPSGAGGSSESATKQRTQGLPPGTTPPTYGSGATKQRTQGLPAGSTPQQYGSSWQKTQ